MTLTQAPWRLGRRPSLDGIRAMAVCLVLIAHSGVPLVGNGGAVGVAIFFTLSGFLITSLLLEERRAFGKLNVLAFYRRRFLRLVPAMVTCVALACASMLWLVGRIPDWSLVIGTLTYTSNWVMADGTFPRPTALGHTWSLGIEEQFYIVWPLVLSLTARLTRQRMMSVLATVSVAVLALRVVLYDGGAGQPRVYFGSDTRADGLLIGALLAFLLFEQRERIVNARLVWGGLAVLGACCLTPGAIKDLFIPTVTSLGTIAVVYAVVQGSGFWLFELRPVSWVGKRSYGLYLYHAPVNIFVSNALGFAPVWWVVVSLPVTLVVAEMSWRYIEQPFLQLKDRDERSHAAVTDRLSREGVEPARLAQAARHL